MNIEHIIPIPPQDCPLVVATMYKFVTFPKYEAFQPILQTFCLREKIYGTILLADEGLNATVTGNHQSITNLLKFIRNTQEFFDIEVKISFTKKQAFKRMKVRLKKEIVTLGQDNVNPHHPTGDYLDPQDWNQMISNPDTRIIDTRNDYEVTIGKFQNALNPKTHNFREFTEYVHKNLSTLPRDKHPKNIAMYCTGGIRCEKASRWMLQQGFENIYQLKGGILKYLEADIPEKDNLWEGECFVFDERVSVTQNLKQGHYDMCHACRMPITEDEKQHQHYQIGIHCPKCFGTHTKRQIKRFTDRQKQINLATDKGQTHIGQQIQDR